MLYLETAFCLQQHWLQMGEYQRKVCVYNKGVLTCLGSQRFWCTDLPLLHISKFPHSPLFNSFIEYCSTCYPTWNIHNGLQIVEQNCIHVIFGTGIRSIYVQIILFYTNTLLRICRIKKCLPLWYYTFYNWHKHWLHFLVVKFVVNKKQKWRFSIIQLLVVLLGWLSNVQILICNSTTINILCINKTRKSREFFILLKEKQQV